MCRARCCGTTINCQRCCHCCGSSPMTSWERLRLGPFQKWKLYGLPPWKFFLNILLIFGTTATIYIVTDSVTPYTRAQQQNWEEILVPGSLDSDTTVYGSVDAYYIYTVDEFMTTLQKFVSKVCENENNNDSNKIVIIIITKNNTCLFGLPVFVQQFFEIPTTVVGNFEFIPHENYTTMTLSTYENWQEMFDPSDNDFSANKVLTSK